MKNLHTLRHFMRYFAPHCEEINGRRMCFVSALEYPDAAEALDVFGGNGFFAGAPTHIEKKYAGLVQDGGDDRWNLSDEPKPETYPIWVAW